MNNLPDLDFTKGGGLVPAIIQHADSGAVLMLGWMNRESLDRTLRTGQVTFWSRSRQQLWTKGEESGNILKLVSLAQDCDEDTLLVQALPIGPTCHTGMVTCFGDAECRDAFQKLFTTIKERKDQMPEGSYTTSLFVSGLDKICLKVAEEALEVVHAAHKQPRERVIEESADLLYHLFVLLVEKQVSLDEVRSELTKRA